jgi:hypothetical protein
MDWFTAFFLASTGSVHQFLDYWLFALVYSPIQSQHQILHLFDLCISDFIDWILASTIKCFATMFGFLGMLDQNCMNLFLASTLALLGFHIDFCKDWFFGSWIGSLHRVLHGLDLCIKSCMASFFASTFAFIGSLH